MYSLNKVQLIGNLTRDPEVRQIPSGQMVCTVGVATNRAWKDQSSGEKKEATEFHNVVCWGRLAEIAGQYVKKGTKVYFEGRLQTRTWDGEDGKKNYRTEIVAENMIILTPKGAGGQDFSGGINRSASSAPIKDFEEEKISVEDLPF
ncbi:MAG: single-stranded DNA-binding protein [bacterium]|nr:single-stranded DNA-binding protein [bacterium]